MFLSQTQVPLVGVLAHRFGHAASAQKSRQESMSSGNYGYKMALFQVHRLLAHGILVTYLHIEHKSA